MRASGIHGQTPGFSFGGWGQGRVVGCDSDQQLPPGEKPGVCSCMAEREIFRDTVSEHTWADPRFFTWGGGRIMWVERPTN
jgi:hypothetical protein